MTTIICLSSGAPDLMDRVFAVHAGVRLPPAAHVPVCSESEKSGIRVSEWPSVIAVSLNADGGVRLIK